MFPCNSQLGYGTWQAAPGEVGNGVYEALKIGYRHLVSDFEDSDALVLADTVFFQQDLAKMYVHRPEMPLGGVE
jgi:hypothetical protein